MDILWFIGKLLFDTLFGIMYGPLWLLFRSMSKDKDFDKEKLITDMVNGANTMLGIDVVDRQAVETYIGFFI